MQATMPINGKISSALLDLNALNVVHRWLPNAESIRPSPAVLLAKQIACDRIELDWNTVRDYILHIVFGAQKQLNVLGEYEAVPLSYTKEWCFAASLFPYNLPTGTNHYILWNVNKTYSDDFDDDDINGRIKNMIQEELGNSNFEFAWYKNPKPTVPQFWHVQVFWRQL
jgi:hypothetical protein